MTAATPPPLTSGEIEAQRIVDAHANLDAAKAENHPSFKDATLALVYHEIHAAARDGALIVAQALLSQLSGGSAAQVPPPRPSTAEPVPAIRNLKECQQQLDMDGCMVGVSRQALDETFAEIDRLRAAKTATGANNQVVSEALCRNHLSGFAVPCAGVCKDTIPGQPHPCEHATVVWGSDAQEILHALSPKEPTDVD